VAGTYYKQMGGDKWAWNIILVGTLFTVPFVLVFGYANTVAIVYNVTAAGTLTYLHFLYFSTIWSHFYRCSDNIIDWISSQSFGWNYWKETF
jgi:hypothetical protein